ncbi:MAG TPA: cation:proton antiporter subunit C [Thermodesulfobacteriota bacterium]|nr:cation:proton antiporter subunit C [Thermodesulfobacteriota bacterium]
MNELPFFVAGWLFLVGLYGVTTSRDMIHMTVCLAVMQSSTYILILAVGYRTGANAPVFADWPVGTPAVDPVVHALVLTDIVVSATMTALLLVLTVQFHKRRGTINPDELKPMKEGNE